MSHDYEKDLVLDIAFAKECIEKAREITPYGIGISLQFVMLEDAISDIEYLKEKAMERDALAERVDELEKALQKVLDDSEIGVVPMSHLEYIKELLK